MIEINNTINFIRNAPQICKSDEKDKHIFRKFAILYFTIKKLKIIKLFVLIALELRVYIGESLFQTRT